MFVFEKTKKYRSNIPPSDVIEGCRQRRKAKRDQGSMQAHKNVLGLCMYTPFLKFEKEVFEEKQLSLKIANKLSKTS